MRHGESEGIGECLWNMPQSDQVMGLWKGNEGGGNGDPLKGKRGYRYGM